MNPSQRRIRPTRGTRGAGAGAGAGTVYSQAAQAKLLRGFEATEEELQEEEQASILGSGKGGGGTGGLGT